jgi:hypothetical protein
MTNEAQILEVPMPECERIRLLEEATNWWLDLQDYKWDVAGQLNERQCRDAKKIDGRIDGVEEAPNNADSCRSSTADTQGN